MPRLLLFASSALVKALQPGERWITVTPPGHDKGQPVLIQPQPDGSAKVIGGAGGSMNHLRLTGVKPEGDYKETLRARAAERRDKAKRQRARDKELGLQTAKAEAHKKVTARTQEAQSAYIDGVAQAMGWNKADYKFDADAAADMLPEVRSRLYSAHLREMVKRADAAVKLNRERIIADADVRAEADLGEVPLNSEDPEKLSVQDLDPVKTQDVGLGFSTDYKARAGDAGEVRAEAAEMKSDRTEAQAAAAERNAGVAEKVREGIELLREPDRVEALAPKLVEAKEALDLLKLQKKRTMAERKAREARKDINDAVVEPKAFVLEVDDAQVDEKVAAEIASDLRTVSTRNFLAEVNETLPDAVTTARRHVGSGAYNSINAVALAAGGAALVDRSVVDVLGIAGAAQVLARRLQADLGEEEFKSVADGVEEFHLSHYMEASKEAIGQARELKATAAEIELGAAEHGDDLAAMQEINRRRAEAIREAQKVLGTALGEMEANAALVYALKGKASEKPFQVSLGAISTESAVQQVRAIGLKRGDYTLESIGGNRVLQITPEGMDRLAKPVNRADLEQVRRNLDIIGGAEDEEGWLPKGVSDRPDLDMHAKPGAAPSLAVPFEPGEDLEASVREYIGGRAADGDPAADIVSDLQSAPFFQKVGGRTDEYRAALDRVAPLQGDDGKLRPADSLSDAFEAMADRFCEARGGGRPPLHRQTFKVDAVAADALHRALAAEPSGVAAFKPIGEMTPQDQGALREFFAKNVAKESADAAATRRELEAHEANEPEKQTEDMFGDTVVNPEWADWRAARDDLRQRAAAGSTTWAGYVKAMNGPERAYGAVQDLVRSKVTKSFADAHNTLRPTEPLKVGRATIRENLAHLAAVDPAAREARAAKERALTDQLRDRVAGRYASGSVREKLDSAREEQAGLDSAQMGFFSAEEVGPAGDSAPAADERYTLGHQAEHQIAAMMPHIGQNFRPGQPVPLYRPSMSGGKNWPRQRAIKLLAANKRVILSAGTGSGKTLIGLGGFTHLHETGAAKRGLFLAPSIAQGGFGADALRFLEPGKFKWHAAPGASREERIAAYKDPTNDFCVMTHQAFRDDMVHLGAQHAGTDEAAMVETLRGMSRGERKVWAAELMEREGIHVPYMNVDEGHDTLDRAGKADSTLSLVVDAFTDNASHYLNASADPIKNDVSEAFSLLQKMDPDRYTDRPEFMRKYGADTLSAKDGLRRELARFQYPTRIDPDITATRSERKVEVNETQRAALTALDRNVAKARIARMSGKVDIEACKAISPSSFEGVGNNAEADVARDIQSNLGLIRDTAVRNVLDGPGGAKIDDVASAAAERKGKQGIVFAHSLAAVQAIKERLTADGFRVATITGSDSAKDKAKRIEEYRPAKGDSAIDVMVASDAGATGANLQSGRWLYNYDTPDTAKTHAQRNGRINRVGQLNDVELMDGVSQHPEEKKRRDRLAKKYALREALTTPMESLDDTGVGYYLRRRQVARENGGLL